MQLIKDFIWFFKESKKFMGYSYTRILFKENGLKRFFAFYKNVKRDRTIS